MYDFDEIRTTDPEIADVIKAEITIRDRRKKNSFNISSCRS